MMFLISVVRFYRALLVNLSGLGAFFLYRFFIRFLISSSGTISSFSSTISS